MNVIGFIWFYANFLVALGVTRIIQIATKTIAPPVSSGLGALI